MQTCNVLLSINGVFSDIPSCKITVTLVVFVFKISLQNFVLAIAKIRGRGVWGVWLYCELMLLCFLSPRCSCVWVIVASKRSNFQIE